jgi:serine/threonine protein kinase/Tfp pilus assembly protein PilF
MRNPRLAQGNAGVLALQVWQVHLPSINVIGKKLGPYLVLERLGAGGMGEVYVAEDERLGRKVALKFLPPEMAADPERRKRFEREARALASLNHPNIVTIHSVEEQQGIVFLVMERVEGASLRKLLERGPLGIDALVAIGRQVAEGLGAAHDARVLHRDLKPDNVMVTEDGRVKLLDFGLAKLLLPPGADADADAVTMSRETSPGMTLGTAGYMAPEQALGRNVDARADLFALGVLVYEMATGTNPFRGETLAASFDALLNRAPAPPRTMNPALPSDLVRILDKALEKNPARRYQSTRELLTDWVRVGTERVSASRALPAAPPRPRHSSIAVLPFRDLSPDKDQEYFCHGLAEELLNVLASDRSLRVLARTSSFSLDATGLDVREIGERLNVEAVLEGSVRKAGTRIRVTVQLSDAGDGYQLWSKRFDRELHDVFAIQDEIAETVVAELQSELGLSRKRSDARRASNMEAYDAYLHGLYAMNHWAEDWVERAIVCFEEAIEKDPDYALAYAALAECHVWFHSGIGTRRAGETIPKAREAGKKALELAPDLPEAHRVLGLIAMNHDWDRVAAERCFARALELNPSSADTRLWNAWRLALLERSYEEALAELRRAEALDPLDLRIKTQIGYVHYFLRDFERALAQFQSVLAVDPYFAFAHYGVGDVRGQQGGHREAIEAWEESARLGGRSVNHLGILAYGRGRAGQEAEARKLLEEVMERSREGQAASLWIAVAWLGLGDTDAVFEWLSRAVDERDGSLVLVTAAPEFEPLRSDERFTRLLERMGLGGKL